MKINELDGMDRISIENNLIFIRTKRDYYQYWNDNFTEFWHSINDDYIYFGLGNSPFKISSREYDGHYSKSLTILWLVFGYGHTWDANKLV